MWFIGVEVEQETSAPPPKKNPGSAPDNSARASRFSFLCRHRTITTLKWAKFHVLWRTY